MMMTDKNLPIKGMGNDIVEIERIRKAYDMHGLRFLQRLFTEKEQDYCLAHKDPVPRLAGRFSVKESIVKALGTGFGKDVSWLDLEILNDTLGKPELILSKKLQKSLRDPLILISISHCELYVTTMAIWVDT